MVETQAFLFEQLEAARFGIELSENAVAQGLVRDQAAALMIAIWAARYERECRQAVAKGKESFGATCRSLAVVNRDDPSRIRMLTVHLHCRTRDRSRLTARVGA
jgi:hypothetical protein